MGYNAAMPPTLAIMLWATPAIAVALAWANGVSPLRVLLPVNYRDDARPMLLILASMAAIVAGWIFNASLLVTAGAVGGLIYLWWGIAWRLR